MQGNRNGKRVGRVVGLWRYPVKSIGGEALDAAALAEGLAALEAGKARHFPGTVICLAALGISLLPMAILRLVLATRPRRTAG